MTTQAPPNWNQWYCTAVDSRSGKIFKGHAWVRASTRLNAQRSGEMAIRFAGVKGRIRVYASPYYPWKDPAFASYIGLAKE